MQFQSNISAIPCGYPCNSMRLSLQFQASISAIPCGYPCNSMRLSLQFQANISAIPCVYPCNSMRSTGCPKPAAVTHKARSRNAQRPHDGPPIGHPKAQRQPNSDPTDAHRPPNGSQMLHIGCPTPAAVTHTARSRNAQRPHDGPPRGHPEAARRQPKGDPTDVQMQPNGCQMPHTGCPKPAAVTHKARSRNAQRPHDGPPIGHPKAARPSNAAHRLPKARRRDAQSPQP